MREALLEPILRRMRLARVLPYVRRYGPGCHLLDIGCDTRAALLRAVEPYIARGVRIDFKAPALKSERLETVSMVLDTSLPFESESCDVVTMLAVLDHLEKPDAVLREIVRVLRPGGGLILTVPSWHAKPVLEFLAFRMGIVCAEEIRDHKRYYNREELYWALTEQAGMRLETHRYFQWRFNNFVFATKPVEQASL